MPVTAKLSKLFYDRFGDQVVDELVDWFNAVDAEYRTVLRETNETNFARFDAKQAQRFAEQDARMETRFAEQDARMETRFAEQDARMETRFAEQDARIEKRFAEQDARVDRRFAELEVSLERRFGQVDAKFAETREFMERALKDQTRWMFVAWASLLIAIIGFGMRG